MNKKKEFNLFSEENTKVIRRAYKAGRKTVTLAGRVFNIQRAPGKAGKPFILVRPANGTFPMGQIEITRFGSSKVIGKILGKSK